LGLQTFTRLDALFTTIAARYVFPFQVRGFKPSSKKISSQKKQEEDVKSKIAVMGAIGALTVALVTGIAFAQTSDDAGSTRHHMHGEFMRGPGMGFPMHDLNLTEDQRAQIKQIFQNESANIKPLRQQEMQARQQLMQLITSGNFDQAKATAIASQEAQTHVQLQVEHAKIASQIYQLLSSDQKAKVADRMSKHQQRMQEHMQKEQQGAPEQQ
jgi:Spy/CpxP family protein refolding chaperone